MIISPSKDDGKKFASHCYGFHRDGGSEGARVRWWMSLHPARAVGVGHGQEKRGQPPARPGTVAEFLKRPLSGQKTPCSVGIFRLRELEKESARDKGSATDREGGKFLVQIEISMEEYFSLSSFPFCCSSRNSRW